MGPGVTLSSGEWCKDCRSQQHDLMLANLEEGELSDGELRGEHDEIHCASWLGLRRPCSAEAVGDTAKYRHSSSPDRCEAAQGAGEEAYIMLNIRAWSAGTM